jgi:mono/diheme cytochrome c family protein
VILVLAVFMAVAGQVGNSASLSDDAELALAGKGYYYSAWGESSYACIYCHANFDEDRLDDGYWRPGHSLWNSAGRPSYYNGTYAGEDNIPLARAINTCIVAFLQTDALKLRDEPMQALLAYICSISPDETSPPVQITRVTEAPEMDGDPRIGEKYFASSCELCHREKGILSALGFRRDASLVLAKIRGAKLPEDAAGEPSADNPPMPFFSAERLSNQRVADILAYWERMKFIREQEAREDIAPDRSVTEKLTEGPSEESEEDGGQPDETGTAPQND